MRGENPAFYPLRVPCAQQELEYKQPQTHGRRSDNSTSTEDFMIQWGS